MRSVPALPSRDRERLLSVLNLLTGPGATAGEVVACSAALQRLLSKHAWTWDGLIIAPRAGRSRGRERSDAPKDWRRTARSCVAAALKEGFLDALHGHREIAFLMTILERDVELTDRQAKWLGDIRGRLRRAGANIP